LVLGDVSRRFFNSLSSDTLDFEEKEKLITATKYIGSDIVTQLVNGDISAIAAANGFNELLEKYEGRQLKSEDVIHEKLFNV
jgi:hypothetical protein